MNYLQKLLKINTKKLDFILILILSLFYKFDINNLKTLKNEFRRLFKQKKVFKLR